MKHKYSLILFVAIALFLLGCSAKNQEVPEVIKNLEKFKLATVEHPNEPVPSFKLTDDKGSIFTSNELKGRVYIVQGFAPGCSSCAREIAILNRAYSKFHDKGLEIISLDIASDDIKGAIDTKKQFQGGDWRWTIDTDNLAVKLGMKTLESTYIVDKEGIIRYKDETISDVDVLSKEIEKLI